MSVTPTVKVRVLPLGQNRWLQTFNFYATGDASGGDINGAGSITNLSPGDRFYFLGGNIVQSNANTDSANAYVEPEEWEALASGAPAGQMPAYLLKGPTTAWDNIASIFSLQEHLQPKPFALGAPLVTAPQLTYWQTPNTEAKTYRATIRLLQIRSPIR